MNAASAMPRLELNAPLRPRPAGCVVPLTTMQRMQMKFTNQQPGGLSTRLRAASLRIRGPLDARRLENCIDAVLQRHESLRTRLAGVDGVTVQVVDPPRRYQLPVVDVPPGSSDIEAEARRLAQRFLEQKVDLSVGPVFGAELLRCSEDDHVLLLGLDHIAGDAFSNGLLCREVWTAYNDDVQGLPSSLPPLSLQFGDYAFWQHQTFEARRQKHEHFWTEELNGARRIEIPNDFEPENPAQNVVATVASLPLGKARSDSLREAARREKTLLPIVVLTTYLLAIAHWSKGTDLTVPFVSHGRHNRPELQNMIGFLANMLWFRIGLSEDESVGEVLKRVHFKFMSAMQHQDFVPDFPEAYNRELLFNWGAVPGYSTRSSVEKMRGSVEGLSMQPFHVQDPWSHKLLTLYSDTPAGIVAVVRYRADILARTSIDRLGRHLRLLADAIAQHPESTVRSVLAEKIYEEL